MKTSLIAATILSASMMSGAANAQESVLHTFLQNMVTSAVTTTANELSADVYQSVANTAYHFSLDANQSNSKASVSVTDIAATTMKDPKNNKKDSD